MIAIDVWNHQGRITAPANVLAQVQRIVSYREQPMLPIPVQRLVKQALAHRRRGGTAYDIARLYADADQAAELVALGWPQERLTPKLFEACLRSPGLWDGWKSAVGAGGWFGAGLLPYIQRALSVHLEASYTVQDHRMAPARMNASTRLPGLLPFQSEAVAAALAAHRGVIDLPPRSGKTHVAIAIAATLGLPTLVVEPTLTLVSQTVDRFREWFPADQVQPVTGETGKGARVQRDLARAQVWIATPQTAAGPKRAGTGLAQGMAGIASRQVLIVDEQHHCGAETWQSIGNSAREAYYRFGLTGTHYRADGKDVLMHAVVGTSIYKRSLADMIDAGRLVPAKVAVVRLGCQLVDNGERLYGVGVVECEERNILLARAAQWLAHLGKRVLVLTKEVAHAERLASLIPGAAQVDGRDTAQVRPTLAALERGELRVVVGTSVIGEGVDVPAADALVYAAGGRSRVKVVQDFFRVLTANAGKAQGIVVDCADNHHPTLVDAGAARLALYRNMRFDADVIDPSGLVPWIQAATGARV